MKRKNKLDLSDNQVVVYMRKGWKENAGQNTQQTQNK